MGDAGVSELSGSEKKSVRDLIAQVFPNLDRFSMFLSDQDFAPLPGDVVAPNLPYDDALYDYIVETVVPQALMEKLLGILATKQRITTKIQALMDPVEIDEDKWFRVFTKGDIAFKYCSDDGVFDYFAKYHPFTGDLWTKVTERKMDQIQLSKHFLAVLTPPDVENLESTEDSVFEFAFKDWLASRAGAAESRKRFMILYEREEVANWWNKWKERHRANHPTLDDEPVFIREIKNDPTDHANVRAELERFLKAPDEPQPKLSNVLLLGNPVANGAPARPNDVALYQFLGGAKSGRVKYWEDGWGESIRLEKDAREELYKYPPIFVRSAADRNTTIAGLKDGMIFPLMNALGYSNDDLLTIWRDIVGKFRRVYWRSEGEWWDGTEINQNIENAWSGSIEDIAAKLAKLAGLDALSESKLRTRFENLPDSDPNRALLSNNLQELGKTVVQQGEYDTVAVSLDSLDESVSRFDRAQLNIVAAHDQRTRPGDRQHTINHFEDWDTRIDRLVSEYFPDREPKIFRIAVLFQNFDKFDGLKFDEGLSVRRWNLLKIKSDNNRIDFNRNDMNHLIDAARDLMQH